MLCNVVQCAMLCNVQCSAILQYWGGRQPHAAFKVEGAGRLDASAALKPQHIAKVGQDHMYTVYIRYFWQGNHRIYNHIRCIFTALANPTYSSYCQIALVLSENYQSKRRRMRWVAGKELGWHYTQQEEWQEHIIAWS